MARLLQTFIICILSFLAVRLTLSLPFYYSWDMDLITVMDVLLLREDLMPAHLNHPGMGMNLMLLNISWLLSKFHLMSDVGLSSLFKSFDPMLVVAEYSYLFRIINGLSCVGIGVFIWAGLKEVFSIKKVDSSYATTFLLLISLTIPGFWLYDILMIRTEIFSMLFWSISFYAVTRSAKKDSVGISTFVAGFFAGLSFFTKIQSLFLLPLLVIIYMWLAQDNHKPNKKFEYRLWVLMTLFLTLAFFSIWSKFPSYKIDFSDRYWINQFFVLIFVLLLALKFAQRKFSTQIRFFEFTFLFLLGALVVTFAPLFSSMDPVAALNYGLINFKVLFFRITKFASVGDRNILSALYYNLVYNWASVLVLAGLAFWSWKKTRRLLPIAFILALCLLQASAGARTSLQDSMWVEITLLVCLGIFMADLEKKWALPLLVILCLFNVSKIFSSGQYKLPRTIAYYDGLIFYKGFFVRGDYARLMAETYPTSEAMATGLKGGSRVMEAKNLLLNNFSDAPVNLTDIAAVKNFWVARLSKVAQNSVEILYRPDQTQSLYFPKNVDLSLVESVGCEKIPTDDLEFGKFSFHGFSFKGLDGKGRETPIHCKFTAPFINQGIVKIDSTPMATFVGY